MTAFYNEIDDYAADWLENLIADGHIAPGVVDRRSIVDLAPADLAGFTQVHFFAGIGVWSLALRRAGWHNDRPVWTGSCPCQPFSSAGKGGGFDDERHLWPHFHHLIRVCRPDVVLGEQVASKDGLAWLDLVSADLEGEGYAVGAVDTCAAGFGAPHIRQRLYWCGRRSDDRMADADRDRQPWISVDGIRRAAVHDLNRRGEHGGLADALHAGPQGRDGKHADALGRNAASRHLGPLRLAGRLADAASSGRRSERAHGDAGNCGEAVCGGPTELGRRGAAGGSGFVGRIERPGPTNGLWGAADWLFCRDGKWRPVEPGTQPLAHGAPARVGRLRAYGNAISLGQSQGFIEAVLDAERLRLTEGGFG